MILLWKMNEGIQYLDGCPSIFRIFPTRSVLQGTCYLGWKARARGDVVDCMARHCQVVVGQFRKYLIRNDLDDAKCDDTRGVKPYT